MTSEWRNKKVSFSTLCVAAKLGSFMFNAQTTDLPSASVRPSTTSSLNLKKVKII